MPASTHTPEQKTQAINLYRQHGPAEAAKQTGIPATTIASWAARTGVRMERTAANARTKAATEAAALKAAERRQELLVELVELAVTAAKRTREPYEEYVGVKGHRVEYDQPPAAAVKHFAQAVDAAVKTLRLEEGKATSRGEVVERSEFDREVEELVEQVKAQA